MKRLSLFIGLFFGCFTHAQTADFILKSLVREDTVLLRWAPANADLMLRGLRNGYQLQRIDGSGVFENNSTLRTFSIEPFESRKSVFENSASEETKNMAAFISDMLQNSSLSAESNQMAFAVLLLGSSTNRDIARMLGLFYEDLTALSGNYSYRVVLNNADSKSNTVTLSSDTLTVDHDLSLLSGSARPRLKQAYLSWEAESLQADYVAYWVERSTDSVHFSRRNTLPYFFLKSQDETDKTICDFVDTTVAEGIVYYYRVTGITHFAETGKSSNTVAVYVPKNICADARIDSIRVNGFERQVFCKILTHCKVNNIQKWQLLRSDSLLFGYTVLKEQLFSGHSQVVTSSVQVPLESGDRYYYKLALIGVDKDTVYSYPYYFFTLDQIPPSTPQNLTGSVNDSGMVSLTWDPNPENDIRGYRVYRSNSLNEEFIEVSRTFCTSPVFRDTLDLRNLTPDVYYRISAVDLNYNNSKTCAPVKLLKPDTIAPVPAVFRAYRVDSGGVYLAWNNSSSADIAENLLLRQGNNVVDTLLRWTDKTTSWLDTSGVVGKGYDYRIVTLDQSKNPGISESVFVNYETGLRPGISKLQAIVNRPEKQVELSWTLPADSEIYSIQLYRAKNDSRFILYKTLREPSATSFTDKDLSMNNTYRYKIKVVYKNGVSSVVSEAVVVIY
ncbi:MAG: fibronectin type III domain-containing protein [Bacteroidetes bacterium]|nr:fibronectin type III domain-containing protein [Bacteroidota bacterium]